MLCTAESGIVFSSIFHSKSVVVDDISNFRPTKSHNRANNHFSVKDSKYPTNYDLRFNKTESFSYERTTYYSNAV